MKFIELSAGCFGDQTGLAINFSHPGGGSNTVTNAANSVRDFQKNGITGGDTGLTANLTGNTVSGIGPTPLIAQNGIQTVPGEMGKITSNVVGEVVYSTCTVGICSYSSTGILMYRRFGNYGVGECVGMRG